MSEEEDWCSYINLLQHHEQHALHQLYFKGKNLQKMQLSRALFRLQQRYDFLEKQAEELDALDRKILASIYSYPCDFATLEERFSLLLNPVKLGMRLAILRSKLLLLGRGEGYRVFERTAQSLQLSFFDIIGYEKYIKIETVSQTPWLNENLLLAVANVLLSQKRAQRSFFGTLFTTKNGEKRWQLVLQVLVNNGFIEYSENAYRPCNAYKFLLDIPLQQRLWYYWSSTLGMGNEELYNLLTPLLQLPSFSKKAWLNWLKHLLPKADSALTEKITMLNLLEEHTQVLRVNPKLANLAVNEHNSLKIPSTGEFHLRQAQLELAPLLMASALKSYDTVSLYKLELPLVKQLWQIYEGDNSFALWYEDLQMQHIELEVSLYQQLQICFQDSQKLLFFQEAAVLCCSSEEQKIISHLPGITEHIVYQQSGVLIFDSQRQVWLQKLNKAGFELFDKSAGKKRNKSVATAAVFAPWPPAQPNKIGFEKPKLNIPSTSSIRLHNLCSASGLNYNAKRQIFTTAIAKQHQLVRVKMLPPDKRELILLPLQIDKESDGSSRIKAFNVETAETLQLNIGKLATVSELCIAAIEEPLGHYLKIGKP